MENQTIMVQLTDPAWTLKAMHLACALASRARTAVVMVRMLAVPHIGLVGEDTNGTVMPPSDQETVSSCRQLAADYDVEFKFIDFQYYSLADALADAAAYVNAQAVFATLPTEVISYWHRFKIWSLRRKLAGANCQLYTLEPSHGRTESIPSIFVRAEPK